MKLFNLNMGKHVGSIIKFIGLYFFKKIDILKHKMKLLQSFNLK